MPFGAALALGTLAVGAYAADEQSDAAKDAARASQRGTDAAIGEQRDARAEYQQNIQPYLGLGGTAVGRLQQLQGGDFSAFTADPGYQFALDQGLEAIRSRGAAGGNYGGGGTTADLLRYATGTAQQGYGDYFNRQYNLATLGQNAAAGAGTAGMNTASNIGNLLTQNANAQGAASINSANAWSNFGSQLGTLAGNAYGQYGGGFNFGGSPGSVSTQQIAIPQSGVSVPNIGVQGRIYG